MRGAARSSALLGWSIVLGCTGAIGETPDEPPGPVPFDERDCSDAADDVGAGRWRRLTTTQYGNAVRDLLGVDADTSAFLPDSVAGDSPFPANSAIHPQSVDIDNYWASAGRVVDALDVSGLVGDCDRATRSDEACAAELLTSVGRRAYRRPLEPAELESLLGLYRLGAGLDFETGIQTALRAMLQSPHFLYLEEYGELVADGEGAADDDSTLRRLDGYEVATRLSILLWDSIPDEALLDAAATGALETVEGIEAEARRLMESERFVDVQTDFYTRVVRADQLDTVSRAEEEFDEPLRDAMRAEVREYLHDVSTREGTVRAVFTEPVPISGDAALDVVYGDDPGVRVGLLSLPGVLASSPPIESDFVPTYRGSAIRANVLCDPLPPPAIAIEFEGGGARTARERLREHQDNPGCAACHRKMDPIGFALENFDDLGRWHDADAEGTIDVSGNILLTDPSGSRDVAIDGAVELGETLGDLEEVRECMARQWFRRTAARDAGRRDGCSLQSVASVLTTGDGDTREALVALVRTAAFRFRRGD